MRRNRTLHVCAHAATQLATLAVCCNELTSYAFAAQEKSVGTTSELRINVAVIDSAHVALKTRTRAQREAGRILSHAGVTVAWVDIDRNSPSELPTGAIVLRLEPMADPRDAPKAVGVALAPDTGDVFYAIVFIDRVRDQHGVCRALEAGTHLETVMGHAIAHEIGHLLLGTNSHSERGLMSAVWTVSDLRCMARGQLYFRPEEAARIRSDVERRNAERGKLKSPKRNEH